jgi:multiple sugar transport system ATP-binding protein
MATLSLKNIRKSYGALEVLHGIDVELEDGGFLVLLGPSGCGKSTLLNIIAGLDDSSSGDIAIGGRSVSALPPKDRNIAMVFQSYALYPTMSVERNIGFGLEMRGVRADQRREAVAQAADMLQVTHLLDRKPANLSGGQRQRVAMGRAIVRNPDLFLFDEPLSNLDAKLRTQMRSEISALHHKVGKTFVYVTHDQVEAMTMASRIIVMNKGVVQQVDTPDEIYDHPANTFVARFVGSPPMNLIPSTVSNTSLLLSDRLAIAHDGPVPRNKELIFGIRPEKLCLHAEGEGRLPAEVAVVERLGAETVIGCRLLVGGSQTDTRLLEQDLIFVRVSGNPRMRIDERCSLDYRAEDVLWFDKSTGQRIS